MYWPATTAPPVASAAKTLISRIIMLSTSETPDTADSPTLATMMESAMPTSTASSCSTIRGRIKAVSARLVNSGVSGRYRFFIVAPPMVMALFSSLK